MLARGFYEWHLNEAGQKNPFFFHLADQDVFAFAGLWDRSIKADGSAIESCALITMPGTI
jgi:putative SOS response-associated peptidase YedK